MGLPPTQVWTREQVAARILAGETLFVLNGQLLRVPPSWLAAHPGGRLAILHYVGRDATDEVEAFHSPETLARMRAYAVGSVEPAGELGWVSLVPPIANGWVRRAGKDGQGEWYNEAQPAPGAKAKGAPGSEILLVKGEKKAKAETEKEAAVGPTLAQLQPAPNGLSAKEEKLNQDAYKELHKRVTDAGLYATPFVSGYGPEFVRYSLLALTAALCYQRGWLIPSALFLGLFWQQLTFFAHDLGHVGVTHNWTLDRLISIFIADFIGGLSIGWWVNVSTPHLS